MPGREETGETVERCREVIPSLIWRRVPRMHCHAHLKWTDGSPVFRNERSLPSQGCRHGLRRRWKGGLQGVTNRFEVDTTVGLDCRIQQGEVTIDGRSHRLPVALPAF